MRVITYGLGGYDPTKPNDNIIEVLEVPDPEPDPAEVHRLAALEKLQKLGLTFDEAEAVIRGYL